MTDKVTPFPDQPQPSPAEDAPQTAQEDSSSKKGTAPTRGKIPITHWVKDGHLVEMYRWEGQDRLAYRLPSGELRFDCEGLDTGEGMLVPRVDGVTKVGSTPGTECLVLPPRPHEAEQDAERLYRDVRDFLPRYVTWTPEFRAGAAAYIMASWVYDTFSGVGYLQFVGDTGSGKTRSQLVLKALCCRASLLVSPTAPNVHRLAGGGYYPTVLIDEVNEKFRGDLLTVLRAGTTRGMFVMRCSGDDFQLSGFSPFCPKVYSGQEPLNNPALASRIISENLGQITPEPHITEELPPEFEAEAAALRARLFRWALDNYFAVGEVEVRWPPQAGSLRQRQVFRPLFAVTPPRYHDGLAKLMLRQRRESMHEMQESFDGEPPRLFRRPG